MPLPGLWETDETPRRTVTDGPHGRMAREQKFHQTYVGLCFCHFHIRLGVPCYRYNGVWPCMHYTLRVGRYVMACIRHQVDLLGRVCNK